MSNATTDLFPSLKPVSPHPCKTLPQVSYGDIWQLGQHRIMCGDSSNAEELDQLIGDADLGCIIADPPYGMNYKPGGKRTNPGSGRASKAGKVWEPRFAKTDNIIGDDKPFDPSYLLALQLPLVLWGGNHYASKLPDNRCWFVWDKMRDHGLSFGDCELAWTNLPGPERIFRHLWNGFAKASEVGIPRVHPTQKPIKLMEWCLDKTQGDVLDPYTGSGSLILASEITGRRCYAMEISPHYTSVAIDRWEQLVQRKATKEC